MTDYFEELGHEPTGPNGPQPEIDEMHMRRLRTLAILNGIDIEIEAPEASKEAIAKLKIHKIDKKNDKEEIECAVCKKIGEEGEIYKILPCKHEFHEECILLWLKKSNSCPLCRFELETDDPDYEEVRQYRAGEAQRRERLDGLLNSMFT